LNTNNYPAWTNFNLQNTKEILHFSQCTSFSRQKGDCDTSKFKISDFTFSNVKGTSNTDYVANLQCSAAAPCEKIRIENVDVKKEGKRADRFGCKNVKGAVGFACTGDVGKNGNGS
jgi:galacturan 1,4-alpha-galacturonidase